MITDVHNSLSWCCIFQLAVGLTELVYYLARSPYGSVLLHDYRRSQFIVVDGEIKLTDVDDMEFEERTCDTDADCTVYFSAANTTLSVNCINGQCQGLNEKQNVFNTGRYFITLLLPSEAPGSLQPLIYSITQDYSQGNSDSQDLLYRITDLMDQYISGAYLERTSDTVDTGKCGNPDDIACCLAVILMVIYMKAEH